MFTCKAWPVHGDDGGNGCKQGCRSEEGSGFKNKVGKMKRGINSSLVGSEGINVGRVAEELVSKGAESFAKACQWHNHFQGKNNMHTLCIVIVTSVKEHFPQYLLKSPVKTFGKSTDVCEGKGKKNN